MKKLTLVNTYISLVVLLICLLAACKKDAAPEPQVPIPLQITSITSMQDTIGAKIIIKGTGFNSTASGNTVKFGTVTATVLSATATELTVIVPAGAGGSPISVTINGTTVLSQGSFTVIATQSPLSISGFAPSIIGVGYPVIITGTSFSADSTQNIVTINGVTAILMSSSTTQLVAIVPLTATTGKIKVTVNAQPVSSVSDIIIKTLTVTTIAGGKPGQFSDGVGTDANFYGSWGIAVDGDGKYYVADRGNNRIRKVTPGGVVTTFAGSGVPQTKDGVGITASLDQPSAVAFDSQGNLFVSTLSNIRKITPAAVVSTFAGDPNGNKGYVDATGTAALFDFPEAMVIDKSDNIFVIDIGNRRIRKISPAGVVTTFAGTGVGSSVDGTGTAASLNMGLFAGICMDANSNLYVSEDGSNKIRKITPAAVVTTIAGSGAIGSLDGPALSATFNGPAGIVADAAGNVYVTEVATQKIRMITANGIVVTLAGNGIQESKDGVGAFASFGSSVSLIMDTNGVIYMIDTYPIAFVRKMVVQ